jgi:hypothetical protein
MSTPGTLTGSITPLSTNCGNFARWSVNTSGAVPAMNPRGSAAQ